MKKLFEDKVEEFSKELTDKQKSKLWMIISLVQADVKQKVQSMVDKI